MNTPQSGEMSAVETAPDGALEVALLSDVGTERPGNEDSCGHWLESETSAIFAVADGVGGYEGGEVASAMAIETTIRAYRDNPPEWGPGKRLYRAVQRANIEIYNRALAVPELRRMATTLTAVVVKDGTMYAAHIGDCRLYLIRHNRIRQLTKDHTMVADRVRLGMMSQEAAKHHPERSALNRCLGHELIASVDQITMPLEQDDRMIVCSDGLYHVLEEHELDHLTRGAAAAAACRAIIETANQRGTGDNLTVAVFKMRGRTPGVPGATGWRGRLARLLRRRS